MSKNTITAIEQALANPTPDEPVRPERRVPGSFNSEVEALEVSDAVYRVVDADLNDVASVDVPGVLKQQRERVRNSVAPAVSRARKSQQCEYEVEVMTTITPKGKVIHIAIVTRTA